MRTSGDFAAVFAAARGYYQGDTDDMPLDPVVRLEGGVWELESRLTPHDELQLEVSLEDFHLYWRDVYNDDDYTLTAIDITDFVNLYGPKYDVI